MREMMRRHEIDRWDFVDCQGATGLMSGMKPDMWTSVYSNLTAKYPADAPFYLVFHAYAVVPKLIHKQGDKLTLEFEGYDGQGDVFVIGEGKSARARQPSNSPHPGHWRTPLTLSCHDFVEGDKVEIWCFFTDPHGMSGVSWPVRWAWKEP